MSEKKNKQITQTAVLTGPQDVPEFIERVIRQDRQSTIAKLLEIAQHDWQVRKDDESGLSLEDQEKAGKAISVFCIYFATMLEEKPMPEFVIASLKDMAPGSKPGVTH